VALGVYAAFVLRAFLADGLPLFFDAHSHLTRAWFAARALAAGSYPSWTFDWYGGYRLLEFFAPGYPLLTGSLGLLVGDLAAATKLLLFAGQLVSVVVFYLFLLRLGLAPPAALFGGLLYLHDAERWRLLAVIGNHPSLFVYVAAPLFLLAVLGADGTRRSNLRLCAGGALALAAMAAGHLTTTAHVLPAFLAFACVALVERLPRPAAALAALGASVLALGALTAAFTFPLLRGLPLVSLGLESAGPSFDLAPVAIALGLRPGSFRWIFVATPGLFWCALALGAGIGSLSRANARWRAAAAGLATCLLSIAVLGERAALGLIFFVAPLSAGALEIACRAVERRGDPRFALALLALAPAAVLVWHHTHDQDPLRYVDGDAFAVYARIPPGDFGRSFDVTWTPDSVDGVYGQSSFAPFWTGRGVPFGGFPQGAPLAVNVQLALGGKLVQELGRRPPVLSEDALDLLALLGVAWLVDRDVPSRLASVPLGAGSAERRGPGLLRLTHASPALFAPRLETLAGEPPLARLLARWKSDPLEKRGQRSLDALSRTGERRDFDLFLPLLARMELARGARRAERFVVERALPAQESPAHGPAAELTVLAHEERLESVEVVARASAPGFLRLAYSFDPALGVALDGAPVESVPDFLGGVVLAFPAGTHTVTLTAPPKALRLGLLAASGGIAATLLLVWALSFLPSRAELP
jgi:hypothetical protein